MNKKNTINTPEDTQTTNSDIFFIPTVIISEVLFGFCCLGIISLDDDGKDFFNGMFLTEIRGIFAKMNFDRISIFKHPKTSAISIFFKYSDSQKKSRHFDDDDSDDYFVVKIFKNGRKKYIEFARDHGNVYHHEILKTPAIEGNVGERSIVHPLTCDGIMEIKKDIEITLEHRHDWW